MTDFTNEFLMALAGGGTGLIGSAIGRVFGFFEEKQKLARLQIELAHELKLKEIDSRDRESQRSSDERISYLKESTSQLIGSYQHDSSYNGALRWFRPAIIVGLVGCTMAIFFSLSDGAVTRADIAGQVVYLTGVGITWLFGDRSGKPNREK